MNASPQEALISVFLQFVEDRGRWAYRALSQTHQPQPREQLHNEMNLLYRKSKVEWKQSKDEEPKKGDSLSSRHVTQEPQFSQFSSSGEFRLNLV